jgi:hypothetical protein
MPIEAARGGAATMYPEYQQRMEQLPIPPAKSPADSPAAGGR